MSKVKDMRTVRYFTPQQVAEMLQLTPQTIYELIKLGRLPAIKIARRYRISAEDMDEFIRTSRVSSERIKDFGE